MGESDFNRDLFERLARRYRNDVSRGKHDEYTDGSTYWQWAMWKEAHIHYTVRINELESKLKSQSAEIRSLRRDRADGKRQYKDLNVRFHDRCKLYAKETIKLLYVEQIVQTWKLLDNKCFVEIESAFQRADEFLEKGGV